MKKFKIVKIEIDGKECDIDDTQDMIPSMIDMNKIRSGYGNSFMFDKVSRKILKKEDKNND